MGKIVYPFGGGLYVNLTNRCSNRCEFCVRNHASGIGDNELWLESEPSLEEVVSALQASRFAEYSEIVFCGFGEPTERASVMLAAAAYAHRYGVKTRLNTNGQGCLLDGNADLVERMKGKIDAVSVSLNAPDAASYDALCHSVYRSAAYDALWAFARDCKKVGIEVAMSVVDAIGEEAVEQCRALCVQNGIPLKVRLYIDDAKKERATRLKK